MTDFNRHEAIDPDIEVRIMETLSQIEKKHDVKILHAVESGSRAWGFHSPNSDYDVRFFYVHKRDWYLSIYPGRDVIELPIDEVYDVSGWDLKKTLHLALKSNAVVMEWLQSPIIYQTDSNFTAALEKFCISSFGQKPLMHHYLNLGVRQVDQTWRSSPNVQIKKYFYMIRPAMALRWMARHEGRVDVPMNLQKLMVESDVPQDVQNLLLNLIDRKKKCEEREVVERIGILDDFMAEEYRQAEGVVESLSAVKNDNMVFADDLFRQWLI